ncbi:DUF1129 family protein [Periweissella ghanensis]|uniref:DUF1129 domain-containing protein n=1 Tax=Periweissella ghanensis TaxID=467997 RepID=A0ABN8BQZ4_9LACO|nr:DUF1129 family protein [Periweissella ghanensis]MCM0600145.1 DUF1129 family protein [Periweissella ghanensis]CAH0419203.1 hypothetical protein WGH24286_01650 [Periweissella ghanensis]
MVEENRNETVADETATATTATPGAETAHAAKQTLTKRNEDFLFQLKKQLNDKMEADQLNAELAKIESDLLAAQATGATAKQLFGTPSEAAAKLVAPKPRQTVASNDAGYWLNALDTGILFLAMFGAVFGFFMLFNGSKLQTNGAPYGVVSLILTAATGGLIFSYIQGLILPSANKPKRPFWYRLIAMILAIMAWMLIYLGVSFIPHTVNPILPGWAYIIIAVLAFIGFLYERRITGITGGFFGGPAPKK